MHYFCTVSLVYLINLKVKNGANINEKDNKGYSPLHHASRNGLVETVELLINKGADINDKSNKGFTALHLGIY